MKERARKRERNSRYKMKIFSYVARGYLVTTNGQKKVRHYHAIVFHIQNALLCIYMRTCCSYSMDEKLSPIRNRLIHMLHNKLKIIA